MGTISGTVLPSRRHPRLEFLEPVKDNVQPGFRTPPTTPGRPDRFYLTVGYSTPNCSRYVPYFVGS